MQLIQELLAITESNDLYSKINDAVMSVGTMKELTSKVRDRVKHLIGVGFNGLNDADIQELMRKADGEEKFALRVAMKVVGRRDPTEA
jgi:hypothetical protein